MQHKAQLGYKTINKITVFREENEDDTGTADPALVFHVVDAPEPPPDEEVEPSHVGMESHIVRFHTA